MQVHAEWCEFVLHNVSLFYAEDQPPRGEGDERVDEGVSSDFDEDPTKGHNCSLTLVNCSGVFFFFFFLFLCLFPRYGRDSNARMGLDHKRTLRIFKTSLRLRR